jgi:phytoene dehydrogenase-like protein
MANARDVVVVGAGHNGLVTACYLARAGYRPLVLERREVEGGAAVTEEIHPGFRCSTLAHAAGPFSPRVARDLGLERHGLKLVRSDVRAFAPDPNGGSFRIFEDAARTASELERISPADARSYPQFRASFERIGRVLAPILDATPPSIDHPSAGDALTLLKAGKGFRGLGKRDAYRLLRWGPMAVADLASEWFETELLRALVAARGITGMFAGPWSAGTALPVVFQAALDGHALAPAAQVAGGMGALTKALAAAAREAGAEVRTGAGVSRVVVKDGRAVGVVLESGEEITARAVVSNADPRRTFLRLVDPMDLDPGFLGKIQNYRSTGVAAKVNYALSTLPDFPAPKGADGDAHLAGRIHVGPEVDYLERAFDAAKYGDFSAEPYMDIAIPSVSDPSLAPAGAHVMSVYVQFAPYALREGDWRSRGEALGETVTKVLSSYAPNLAGATVARQVITPLDLEETYGLTGGHTLHGETTLDQLYAFRPLLGWAQYRTPIDGLYLCGAGTHPGGGVTGLPGANAGREIAKDLKRGRSARA